MDKLVNEKDLMVITTKNIIKNKLDIHLDSKRYFSLEILRLVYKTKLINYRTW